MSITNINANTAYFQSQQPAFSKKEEEKIIPAKTEQATASEPTKVAASSLTTEKVRNLDLKNITPKDTYNLAVNLLESESIGLHDYVKLMAIGLNQEYPPGQQINKNNPSTAPFDLLSEIDSIASGTHEYFTSGTESDKEEAKTLLDLLSYLPAEMEKVKYTSIDIKV